MLSNSPGRSFPAFAAALCVLAVSLVLYGQFRLILPLALLLMAAALVLFLVLPKEKRLFYAAAFLCAVISLLSLGLSRQRLETPALALSGKTLTCSGVLSDLPYEENGRFFYRLTLQEIPGWKAGDVTVLISSRQSLRLEPYDRLSATLRFDSFDGTSKTSSPARDIVLKGRIQENAPCAVSAGEEKPPDFYLLMLRRHIKNRLSSQLPPREAAFAHAIVLGDKHSFDASALDDFRQAGLSHIIVVSGFHLSVIVTLILLLTEKLLRQRRKIWPILAVMLGILPYMALAGFTPSVVRAGLMVELVMLGRLFFVRLRVQDALGGAVALMTMADPYLVLDASFLLSVSATAGILLWGKGFYRLLTRSADVHRLMELFRLKPGEGRYMVFFQPLRLLLKGYRLVCGTAAAALSAGLATMPVIMVRFETLSLYALPANLLVSPVVFLNLSAHLLLLLLDGLPLLSFLTPLCSSLTCLLTDYVLGSARLIASAPWAQLSAEGASVIGCGCLIAFSLLLLHRYYWANPGRERGVALSCVLLALSAAVLALSMPF